MRRYTRASPCPVCRGFLDAQPPDLACVGYTGNGKAWCTDAAVAGPLLPVGGVYPHKLEACPCGKEHEEKSVITPITSNLSILSMDWVSPTPLSEVSLPDF